MSIVILYVAHLAHYCRYVGSSYEYESKRLFILPSVDSNPCQHISNVFQTKSNGRRDRQSIPLFHLFLGGLDGLLGFHCKLLSSSIVQKLTHVLAQRRKHQPRMGEICVGATKFHTDGILLSSIMYSKTARTPRERN